jgi:uncharacterized phiE125 gp8 family phage protein
MDAYPDYLFEAEWGYRPVALGLKPVRTAAPAVKPVVLADIKKQVRVLHDDDDADLEAYLDAAIEHLDGYAGILGRALINQTWRQDFSGFGCAMRLPLEPLQSVSAITYYDGAGAQQTLATSVYEVVTDDRSPFVALKSGQSWPVTFARRDAVSVTFIAGYGAAATDVPARIKQAIKLHAAHMYAVRETSTEMQLYPTETYERLVKPFVRTYS